MAVANKRGLLKKTEVSRRSKHINAILMLLFFTSTDTVLFGTNSNYRFLFIPRIVGLSVCILLPIILNKGRIRIDKRLFLCAVMVLMIATSAIINQGKIGTIVSRIIPVCVACSIAMYCTLDEFASVFCKFVYIVSVIALLMEAISYVFPMLIYSMPSVINTSGYRFATCFLGSIRISDLSKVFIRSNGIFWEPGAFAVYLNFAIFFQLIILKQHKLSRLFIYLIALSLTFSTAGYICFIFLMVVFIPFSNSSKSHLKLKRTMLFLTFIAVVIICSSPEIMSLLFGKITNQESTTVVRWFSFLGGFKIALNTPFTGVFSNNISDTMQSIAAASGGMLTNTWSYQFAAYGIPFGALFTFCSYKFFSKIEKNIVSTVGFFTFLLLSYVGEMFFSFIPFIFVFYGLRETNENNSNKFSA